MCVCVSLCVSLFLSECYRNDTFFSSTSDVSVSVRDLVVYVFIWVCLHMSVLMSQKRDILLELGGLELECMP